MEYINDNNKKNETKLSIKKYFLNSNIQTKKILKTEKNIINDENKFISPKITESLIITPTLIDDIKNKKNNNLSKREEKPKNKGCLYKHINPSYFKKSLGSIPYKTEKILLDGKNKRDRFSDQMEDNTPGVGSYDLNYDWNLKNKSVKMSSLKEKRFSDFYNFLPGVGQYDLDNGKILQEKKDNLRYKSLYSKTKTNINDSINKDLNINLYCYNPKILNDIMQNKKNFNFCSYSGRNNYRGSKIPTPFDKIDDKPGPGYYFINSKENLKMKPPSYNNTDNAKSLKQFMNKYLSDINDKEDIPSFNLKQNGNKRENKLYNLEDIYKLNRNNKKIVISEKEELDKILKENEKNTSSKNLYFKIRENMELHKIKTILGNDNGKPDFFYLSPDRWKTKKNTFKSPGPAYYFYN